MSEVDFLKVRELYETNPVAEAILDYEAALTHNPPDLTVSLALSEARKRGLNPSRGVVVGVLRKLEFYGAGKMVSEDVKNVSSLHWTTSAVLLARFATGERDSV